MKTLKKYMGYVRLLFITIVISAIHSLLYAQPVLPQRTLTVTPTQSIHFGTFGVGISGGTVTVAWEGTRSSTGDVVRLSMAPTAQPAIFEIKLCPGRDVIISFDPTAILSNGSGGSLLLHIGPNQYSNTRFPTGNDCNFITPLRVGGTLDIPGSAPVGAYTGSFSITFNQE